jgi:hypothetical protein
MSQDEVEVFEVRDGEVKMIRHNVIAFRNRKGGSRVTQHAA